MMQSRILVTVRTSMLMGGLLLAACATASEAAPSNSAGGTLCKAGQPSCNLISGDSGNSVAPGAGGATIAGGGGLGEPNQVSANFGTVGGGRGNIAGEDSTVAGGSGNIAMHFRASVGGGTSNRADGEEATVAGGLKNTASERFAVVGGGSLNVASDIDSTVAGGSGNIANYRFTTVGGGTQNLASNVASVVAGGDNNHADGAYSTAAGGLNNEAAGYLSAVLGGAGNTASGSYSVVSGGFANTAAANYSFAAGSHASVSADHQGAVIFAGSSTFPFPSLAPNEFAVRATGGVRIVSSIDGAGTPLAGVRLSPGSGSWESLSDYNAKAGFAPISGQRLLQSLLSIPISTWYYRGQGPSIRHIGPMAQDFYRAFNLGQDARYISTVDEEGVALAAIQELYLLIRQPDSSMQQQVDDLEQRLAFSNGLAAVSILLAVLALRRRVPLIDRR